MVAQASSSAMQGRKPPLQAQASLSPQLTPLGRHASTTRQHISIFGSSTIRQTGSQGWRGTTGCCNLLPQVEHRPQAVPADQLDVWDVVEYQQQPVKPSSTLCLGLVQQVSCCAKAGVGAEGANLGYPNGASLGDRSNCVRIWGQVGASQVPEIAFLKVAHHLLCCLG